MRSRNTKGLPRLVSVRCCQRPTSARLVNLGVDQTNQRFGGRRETKRRRGVARDQTSSPNAGGRSYRLPPSWEGKAKGSAEGNPAMADGRPVWRLDQVWPPEPAAVANYHPMVWRDGFWVPTANAFGDQPKAEMKDRGVRLEFRAKHGDPAAERICGLVFIVPRDGTYEVKGSAELRLWDGNVGVRLALLHKTADGAKELASLQLEKGRRVPLTRMTATARAGDELVLLPRPDGAFTGGDVTLRDIEIAPASGAAFSTSPDPLPGTTARPACGSPANLPAGAKCADADSPSPPGMPPVPAAASAGQAGGPPRSRTGGSTSRTPGPGMPAAR